VIPPNLIVVFLSSRSFSDITSSSSLQFFAFLTRQQIHQV
jgi:hypothetical protein